MIKKILNLTLAVFIIIGMFAFGNSNKVEAEESFTTKYAVQIYGIGQDELIDGSIAGLTFGPALGQDFMNTYISHTPTGTTSSGHAHRCVHNDSWETIARWNFQDPYVYEQCVGNNCTHSVNLSFPDYLKNTSFVYGGSASGDGVGTLYNEFKNDYHRSWNPITKNGSYGTNEGGWGASRIRAMMNGYDELTMLKGLYSYYFSYIENIPETNYTSGSTLIDAFPQILKDNIGSRKTLYDSVRNSKTVDNLKTSYDKLWLLSPNEMTNDNVTLLYNGSYDYYQHPLESNGGYQKFLQNSQYIKGCRYNGSSNTADYYNDYFKAYRQNGNTATSGTIYYWWLRSSNSSNSSDVLYVYSSGYVNGFTAYSTVGVSPCFSLDRSYIPLSDPSDPDYNPMDTGSFYVSERGVNANNHWVDNGDNTWTYTFDVFDDSVPYWYWEEDMVNYENDIPALPGYKTIINKQGQITNTSTKTSSLLISKEVEIDERDKKFDFTITLQGERISGTQVFSDVVFKDGVGTIKLGNGESKLITNLPPGTTYSVEETPVFQYETRSSGETGTLVQGETSEAKFINTLIMPTKSQPGSYSEITIKKTVEGNNELDDSYHFLMTLENLLPDTEYEFLDGSTYRSDLAGSAFIEFDLKDGEEVTLIDIPIGTTYQVTEAAGPYISSYIITDARGSDLIAQTSDSNTSENLELITAIETVDPFEEVTVNFTNRITRKQNLKIKKEVVGNAEDKAKTYEIVLELSNLEPNSSFMSDAGMIKADEDGYAEKSLLLKDGDIIEIAELPVGTQYRIKEIKNNCYSSYLILDENNTNNISNEKDANFEINQDLSTRLETINENEEATVIFTNTSQVTLLLTKQVDGNMGNKSKEFDFNVNITYPERNSSNADNETAGIVAQPNLAHSDSVEYKVPYGSSYVISEENYSQEGYRTYVNNGIIQKRNAEGEIKENKEITFRNINGAAVPTELRFYAPAPAIIAVIACIFIILKRGKSNISN